MRLPSNRPLVVGELTKEQFDAEIKAGLDDIETGRVVSADDVENEMRRMYGARDISRQLEQTEEW